MSETTVEFGELLTTETMTIGTEMFLNFPTAMQDIIKADVAAAGFDIDNVSEVEYFAGRLIYVTVRVPLASR